MLIPVCYVLITIRRKQVKESIFQKNPQRKVILYWTTMWSRSDFWLGLGDEIFKNCPYSNCFTTNQHDYIPVDQYDAIIFHGPQYGENSAFGRPEKRKTDQIYIFYNQESPSNTRKTSELNNFYNWTMTYRSDSDIKTPYGFFIEKNTNYQLPTLEELKNKNKMAVWMVSHCSTYNKREDIVENLQKHFQIDVFGACGSLKCDSEDTSQCYKLMEKNYRFYMSFENSNCQDYVTEKMYNLLKYDIVPVVYGGANYTEFAPPHSVINVLDFQNLTSVANYLEFLAKNPVEYLKYFEWKKRYVIADSNENILCDLCKKLHEPLVPKSYNIGEWWWGENDGKCFNDVFRQFVRP